MMRGPSYDDNYIARKMASLDTGPTFSAPAPSYGYMQGYSTPPAPGRMPCRMGPPPPAYYDYDYGYGGHGYGGYPPYRPYGGYGYGGYAPPAPMSRYRNYDPYLDDDYDVGYIPRYRPARLSDAIVDLERDKHGRSLSPVTTSRTSAKLASSMPSEFMAKHFSPGMLQDQVDKMRNRLQAMAFSLDPSGPVTEIDKINAGRDFKQKYSSGPRNLACVDFAGSTPQWKRRAMTHYPPEDPAHLSELSRDEVLSAEEAAEKDPEKLVLKDRLSMKIHNYLSDTLSPNKFQKYIKSYRKPGDITTYSQVRPALPKYTSKYSKSDSGAGSSKWEEPDAVFPKSGERKTFSKVETGSSLFTTEGYVNRKRDTIADKVRDYYYYEDANETDGTSSVRFSESGRQKSEGDDDDLKKERRKKKKSKESEEPLAIDTSAPTPAPAPAPDPAPASTAPAPSAEVTKAPAVEPSSAPCKATEAAVPAGDADGEIDEKEKKRLEKKKRKAEREAAAKAAMEAELAALAEAEAELTRLEAKSTPAMPAAPEPPADTTPAPAPVAEPEPVAPAPAPEVKESEESLEKCESPSEVVPECPPAQVESDPSLFPPSATTEEPFQVEEEQQPAEKDEFAQDLPVEVAESEPKVAEVKDEPQVTEEDKYEPEIFVAGDADIKKPAFFRDGDAVYRTEARLCDESQSALLAPVSNGDDLSQQIGDNTTHQLDQSEGHLQEQEPLEHGKEQQPESAEQPTEQDLQDIGEQRESETLQYEQPDLISETQIDPQVEIEKPEQEQPLILDQQEPTTEQEQVEKDQQIVEEIQAEPISPKEPLGTNEEELQEKSETIEEQPAQTEQLTEPRQPEISEQSIPPEQQESSEQQPSENSELESVVNPEPEALDQAESSDQPDSKPVTYDTPTSFDPYEDIFSDRGD